MNNWKNIFFIGVGGIGMSALARYCNFKGFNVAGYDSTSTKLTNKLKSEGVEIIFDDNVELIPSKYLSVNDTLVVYTPAIPERNTIFQLFSTKGYKLIKRAEFLGFVTKLQKGIAIAGTHGKTSISTFTAHLLNQSDIKCTAFLGGISVNYDTNFLYNDKSEYAVIEADEFDRSFLKLNPYISLVSSIEADHLDIYNTVNEIYKSFNDFVNLTSDDGFVIIKKGFEHLISSKNKIVTYGINEDADYHISNVRRTNYGNMFDFVYPKGVIKDLSVNILGRYNLENVVAAITVALHCSIHINQLRLGLESLKGVYRRFQIRSTGKNIYIDDYAHHPTEIQACIESVRGAFPDKKVTVIFQPHLFSRTRDFYKQMGQALSLADCAAVLPIYPARELPIEGVSSSLIFEDIRLQDKFMIEKNEVEGFIKTKKPQLLLTMGAGDIGVMAESIENYIKLL